ncbi:MAG: hypothetical protein U9M94_03645 [Patescibacteria group bacterium]|nr:hypothetical protein [Patescibacteria group bacterium]
MFDDLNSNNKNSADAKPAADQKNMENKNNTQNKSAFTAVGNDLDKANPQDSKKTAEDMFAEIEPKPNPKPSVFEKKQENSKDNNQHYDKNGNSHQKIFFLVFIVSILILLGIGGFWAYNRFIGKISDEPAIDKNINTQEINKETNKEEENSGQDADEIKNLTDGAEEENLSREELDSDGDGLTDEEEWRLGTAIDNVDTDNDGLFDREEVKVYKTDPRKPDTDGDGYIDGDEVDGGYNPLGSGRLLDIKK